MDKAGEILWELTIMMKFIPILLIIFFVWLFLKIRASNTARRLNRPEVRKAIKKEILNLHFPRFSFIPCISVMALSVVYYIIGSMLMLFGGVWALLVVEGNKNPTLFDKFADFVFYYWYLSLIFGIIFAIAFVVFFSRGIYINIVYRKKLKEILFNL